MAEKEIGSVSAFRGRDEEPCRVVVSNLSGNNTVLRIVDADGRTLNRVLFKDKGSARFLGVMRMAVEEQGG